MTPASNQPRRPRAIAIGCLILVLAAGGRAGFLRGIIAPVRIAGDSMAETLYGDHRRTRCQQCQHAFRFAVSPQPRAGLVVCPNCGETSDFEQAPLRRGQRVVLDRWPIWTGSPRRWDVVAFQTPGQEQHLAVKRVVGLPGERIGFRRGDVYADGRIVRKSLTELRRMALVVHDDGCRPQADAGLPERWQNETTGNRWQRVQGDWSIEPRDSPEASTDWLVYHHWSCWPGPSPRAEESPVMDNYGFNQSLSRQLHLVTDLLLICRMRCSWDRGQLEFRIHDGYHWYRLVLTPGDRMVRLYQAVTLVDQSPLPAAGFGSGVLIEVAVCDRQVLLGIEEGLILRFPIAPVAAVPVATARPLGIGVAGMEVRIDRLQVQRDIYYLDPRGLGSGWESSVPLASNQYFVVGDNIPVSEDSRHWPSPGLTGKSLLGKVLHP